MFMKGEKCELRALEQNDWEAHTWTRAVNAGLTTQHLLTGSIPMRPIDIQAVWSKEMAAGSVEFAIWVESAHHLSVYDEQRGFSYKFIGTCGLYGHRDIYRLWEFRILIFDPAYIGKGIGEEATRLTVNYGFQRLNAHRIWLGVNEANVGALKCYEKVGFKEEGRKRKELFCFGQYYDAVQMGILEDEWKSRTSEKAESEVFVEK
jgi:RimJ/RimL family protein N-acetyltransferase